MPTWKEVTEANPAHSHNFARKWKMLEAQGKDIHGEARLVDAMVERNSTILDAGCGTGRVGGELLRRGHSVVGIDVDPILIEHAEHDFPDGEWFVGDLCTEEVPEGPLTSPFLRETSWAFWPWTAARKPCEIFLTR